MKKHIGKVLALYPVPLIVVGSMVSDKPNYPFLLGKYHPRVGKEEGLKRGQS